MATAEQHDFSSGETSGLEIVAPSRLVVDSGDHPGMIHPLRDPMITIGRGPENTIQIIDTRISRVHVRLELKTGGWTIEDLRSKNGTQVNGKPIASIIRLVSGDTIHIGSTVFIFENEVLQTDGADDAHSSGLRLDPGDTDMKTSHVIELPADDDKEASSVRSVPRKVEARLKSIYEIGKLIQSILDLDELLDKVMEIVCQVLHPTHGSILLYDKKMGVFVPKVIRRPDGSTYDIIISGSIIHQALKDRVAVIMTDGRKDVRFKASDSIAVHQIRSAICVPLISKGEVLGVLYIDTREQGKKYRDADLQWAAGVGTQAALAINVALMHREMVSQHEREREIEIARSIQMNLLPKSMPRLEGFEFGGISRPARMVGGDYFDIIELPEGDFAIAIADVSGKGVPAALLLASVRSAVRIESRSLVRDGLVEVANRLNQTICDETMSNMFVSAVICYFEPETRRLTYCNAGHVHPILRYSDGKMIELKEGGCFLGIMPGIDLEQGSVKLPEGSMVVFVTDGVTDAVNPDGEPFGNERLTDFIHAHSDFSAMKFCERLDRAVLNFQGPVEQTDDLTVMAIKAV